MKALSKLLIPLLVLLGATAAHTQSPVYLSVEALGSGGLGSINVEKTWIDRSPWALQGRLGFSFLPIDANTGAALVFPLLLHGLYGPGDHRADLGIGQALTLTTKGGLFARMPLVAGYRWQPRDRKVFVRVAYTPLVSYLVDFQWEHRGGIAIGYRINN